MALPSMGSPASPVSLAPLRARAQHGPRGAAVATAVAALCWQGAALAQYPAPYPQQPYPGQYPPQPLPPPAQAAPQPYPQQAQYPPRQQPYPQQYPPPQYAPGPGQAPYPQPYGPAPAQPGYAPYPNAPGAPPLQAPPYPQAQLAPPRPPPSPYRSPGEMVYLYGISAAYGVGTGVWIDALAGVGDPGIALIAPLLLGGAMPVGAYIWDSQQELDRGVPSSIATGLLLGGVEGIAIDGLQWQLTGNGGPNTWSFSTWTSMTFVTATAGGIGGYAFGEWLRPDPRSLAFIASGAGWGSMAGILLGSGVVSTDNDWADGAAIWGFAGYNAGIAATAVLSAVYTPSWETLKYMWVGDLIGTAATTPVYLFYLGGGDVRHGMIANAVGGIAGLAVAAALTGNMTDASASSWTPPFQLAVSPSHGGLQATAFGQF